MKQPSTKKLLIALLLLGNTLCAQTVDKSWAGQINVTFEGIDKNNVPHGLLKDYAMEFAELANYDGVMTDTNYVHRGTLWPVANKKNGSIRSRFRYFSGYTSLFGSNASR